tara:strand:- start:2111 stop:2896 length:786 start_codon:yes stop_codon:yes gene_type:complete
MILTEEWKAYLQELQDPEKIDVSSFEVQNELNPKFWDVEDRLDPEIGDRLYEIAKQFFNGLGLAWVDIVDITFTGSLANFTWSQYSDIDLHVLIDYNQVDENQELVKDYLRKSSGLWNRSHDIRMKGYEIEVYIQDANEVHHSGGVYSIKNDEWIEKPSISDPKIDFESIQKKAAKLMEDIDEVSELFRNKEYAAALEESGEIKRRIRKFRQSGLEKGGIFSVENLAFKVLRRNGYLQTLSSLRILSYDKSMSINGESSDK